MRHRAGRTTWPRSRRPSASRPGLEVHARDPHSGRLVVVQERATIEEHQQGLRELQALPGVLTAELVLHYQDPDDRRRPRDHGRSNMKSDLSRRDFVKTSVAAATAAAVGVPMADAAGHCRHRAGHRLGKERLPLLRRRLRRRGRHQGRPASPRSRATRRTRSTAVCSAPRATPTPTSSTAPTGSTSRCCG